MKNQLTSKMVEELNLKLEKDNTCLRYLVQSDDILMKTYTLTIVDKYISSDSYNIPCITREFENIVRSFFKDKFNVEDTGYSNSIINLCIYK